ALECLGGAGFIEDSAMPRLYRQAPLNGIWEGSGNVICLDVLRTLQRDALAGQALRGLLKEAAASDRALAEKVAAIETQLRNPDPAQARLLVEDLALVLQGKLLRRHSPPALADAFIATRIARRGGFAYGTLPAADTGAILHRAWPPLANG
ncbi:conserved hypothetical protein, partial [Ricinus communis]